MYQPNPSNGPYHRHHYSDGSAGDSSPGLALGIAIGTLILCNLIGGVLGIVFAAVAMAQNDGEDQDRFVKYAWIGIFVGWALSLLGIALI